MSQKHALAGAYFVPGLPHLLKPEWNPSYDRLATAMRQAGDRLAERGVERILYYSTQWMSVLGQSFQAKEDLRGEHVDENWHDVEDLGFSFRVDQPFAKTLAQAAEEAGYQSRLIDYEGFPVDTGTIVADRLLNQGRFRANMVSCCVYSDYAETKHLASTLAQAVADDGVPTAVVAVSLLSGRYFTSEIDYSRDQVRSETDDRWNRKILELLESGDYGEAESQVPEFAKACKADMGFKALAFLQGAGACERGGAEALAYGPIYGTGAAVVQF